jgi:hypothetical protein
LSTVEKEKAFETWLRRRARPQQVHHSYVERFTRAFFAGELIIVRHLPGDVVYIGLAKGEIPG